MLQSMTGFASAQGSDDTFSWSWELRSVNGKGLDLRLRLPDWIEGLETALRARMGKALSRGNINLTLRVQSQATEAALALNSAQLESVLSAMAEVEARAMERGLSLAPANAANVLGIRGVLDTAAVEQDTGALKKALLADFEPLLESFLEMRVTEGTALAGIMGAQLEDIARLTAESAQIAEARKPEVAANFRAALARVLENADKVDEARVTQELAVLAVKADVTEEIDRLGAHVEAARELIAKGSPIGRKLDFLAQEFNREANTLCSKSQNTALTAVGLELKTVIDQMREQVQNVE